LQAPRQASSDTLRLIMSPHFRNATGRSAFSSSRIATRRNRSLTQVARGRPAYSAASRKACFSAVESLSSMYSSSGFFFLGRPRFAIELLYQQKWGKCKIFLDTPLFLGVH